LGEEGRERRARGMGYFGRKWEGEREKVHREKKLK
jgi:hypothetical protein